MDKNISGVSYLGHVTNEVAMVDLSYVESLDSDVYKRQDMSGVHQYMMQLYFESAGMILTLISLGKYLESRSKKKTTQARCV